jgi:hypothetical protein
MLWTAIGLPLPMVTLPMRTARVGLRWMSLVGFIVRGSKVKVSGVG